MHRSAVIPRLHIVTNDVILARPDFLPIAEELLVVLQRRIALHVRGHDTPARAIFDIVDALSAKAGLVGALLLANDRVDIALAAGAGGVQLGVRSLPVAEVRRIAPALRIGYSAHSATEAAAAEQAGANFVIAGSIYRTQSHAGGTPGGLELLDACVEACAIPVIAIGGITPERTTEIDRTGAYGVAVIGAVWDAPDPVHAAEEFVKMLEA
ncbi:MAG TPA: thiamine phosphate synthase [Longimicrobiales bacterium]